MHPLPFDIFPVLTGDRLRLRHLQPGDAPRLSILRSDAAVNRYLGRPEKTSEPEAEAFIRKISDSIAKGQSLYWVIELNDTPGLIGTICLWNLAPEKDQAELGYEMMPAYQGRGLMQEAVKLLLDFCFGPFALQTVIALPLPENAPSVRLLERNRFTLDKNAVLELEPGEPEPAFFSLTQQTWHGI